MLSISRNKPANILILGDLILDRYIEGNVRRISPEAPVPILFQTSERDVLGGAGNVASNICALGGNAYLVGLLGNDDPGAKFKDAIEAIGIKLFEVVDPSRKTTIKTRLLGDRQQLLRVDSEDLSSISPFLENSVIESIKDLINKVSAIIISDYRKGLLSPNILKEAIKIAKLQNIPVFIDPKGYDLISYKDADYIKPNRSELELLTKMSCRTINEVAISAQYLSKLTNSNILVTLSQEGMILFKRDGSVLSLPTEAKEVFDVSGAGDTAIASFAYAIVQGAPPETAARFANVASGIAVSKIGTASVCFDEINRSIKQIYAHEDKAVYESVDLNRAKESLGEWRVRGFKVGFTNGCFDLLHPGHIALLRGAAAECDRLIVGLNSDASVKRLKGNQRPIQNELARAEVLSALECVDLVVIFDDDTPLELIRALSPDVLIKGSDYEESNIVGADFVKSQGGRVVRIGLREGHSTTELVKRSNTK